MLGRKREQKLLMLARRRGVIVNIRRWAGGSQSMVRRA
jgi:hypothetical protein